MTASPATRSTAIAGRLYFIRALQFAGDGAAGNDGQVSQLDVVVHGRRSEGECPTRLGAPTRQCQARCSRPFGLKGRASCSNRKTGHGWLAHLGEISSDDDLLRLISRPENAPLPQTPDCRLDFCVLERSQNKAPTLNPHMILPRFFSKILLTSLAICGGLRWRIRGPVLEALWSPPSLLIGHAQTSGTHLRKSHSSDA